MTFDHDEYLRLVAAVFAGPAGQAFLRVAVARAEAAPSYQPGDTFDQVAWREGRKAALRQLAIDCQRATQPPTASEE
jgi:hypothetical protein